MMNTLNIGGARRTLLTLESSFSKTRDSNLAKDANWEQDTLLIDSFFWFIDDSTIFVVYSDQKKPLSCLIKPVSLLEEDYLRIKAFSDIFAYANDSICCL